MALPFLCKNKFVARLLEQALDMRNNERSESRVKIMDVL